MNKITMTIANLVLLTSSLFCGDEFRSGYSNGSNIHITTTEKAYVSVYMIDDLDDHNRLESSQTAKPLLTTDAVTKFSLTEKGYYVIKVTPLSDAFSAYLASN